jgi:hypothetical protein
MHHSLSAPLAVARLDLLAIGIVAGIVIIAGVLFLRATYFSRNK